MRAASAHVLPRIRMHLASLPDSIIDRTGTLVPRHMSMARRLETCNPANVQMTLQSKRTEVASVSDEPEHEQPAAAGEAPDPLIGVTVGRYRIESLLEVGGMGRVYRAIGAEGELVALKLVRSDLAEDSVFRKRFEREAMIAQQVKNPHVVPVLDTGEHEGVPYLSQRFIEGGSLEQKLKREGRLDVPTTLKLCARGRGRAGRAVRRRDGAPRREARERPARPGRHRADHRLRAGEGQPGHQPHAARPGAGLAGLHVARADPRRGGQRGDRRVRARVRHLPVPQRHAPVRRPQRHADPVGAAAGRAARSLRGAARRAAGAGSGGAARAREEPRRAPAERRRVRAPAARGGRRRAAIRPA